MQHDLFADMRPPADSSLILSLLDMSDRLLVKKLSNNDRDWARFANKHQAGIYIPPVHRDGGFFPPLVRKERDDPGAKEIREVFFTTDWPQTGDSRKTRLVHYTSKGPETHMTGVPKEAFRDLLPASLLLMARIPNSQSTSYRCMTIQSGSEDEAMIADILDMDGGFHVGEFDPATVKRTEEDLLLAFADQVVAAWLKGDIAAFAAENATMPTTAALAEMARRKFLTQYNLASLDPFALDRPGDALREISRTIEWELFRTYQRRERAVALVRLVLGDRPHEADAASFVRRMVGALQEIDALMLSASQQRKSRAGYSYEHQIEAMLAAGTIPFEKQVIIDARKRPDFVLPSLAHLKKRAQGATPGLILSAKTTLRERWKQVQREMRFGELFLATVDENIASNAIADMAQIGILLVVPESLKQSDETEYADHANVIGFHEFSREVLRPRMGKW